VIGANVSRPKRRANSAPSKILWVDCNDPGLVFVLPIEVSASEERLSDEIVATLTRRHVPLSGQ